MKKESINIENHWKIDGYCYWQNEISTEDGIIWWVNVAYHLPLCGTKSEIQKLLAVSAYELCRKYS